MEDTEKRLKEVFSGVFNGQGLSLMSKLVLAVLKTCTVNYAQLALEINVQLKVESNFKRIHCLSHGRQIRIRYFKKRRVKLISVFRRGPDHLRSRLLNILSLFNEIHFFSCT